MLLIKMPMPDDFLRDNHGKFAAKSSQIREVRSIRTTQDVWNRLDRYAKSQGISIADVIEKWVYTLPTADQSTGDPPFSIRLWQVFESIARSEVGDSLYGHPVRLKAIFAAFPMPWDEFLSAVAAVAASDGSLELIGCRGQNYQVGDRRVAALTYHQ